MLMYSFPCVAQLDLPELSPQGRVSQTVGSTKFEIQYGRPAARQRIVFGDLVPYGRLWRTGAGKCSAISFDKEVVINGNKIAPGIYAIVTIPGKSLWTIMLNSDTAKLYGDPSEYDVLTEVARFEAVPNASPRHYESLTMELDIIQSDAVFYLSWENTQVSFRIETGSHDRALRSIAEELERNPNNTELLSGASYYYLMTNESTDQVLEWLNKALQLEPDRWTHRLKVDALEKLRRYGQARQAAANAIAFLRKMKPVEYEFDINMYRERIKAWDEQEKGPRVLQH